MSTVTFDRHAEAIAKTVDPEVFELDPITLVTVIVPIIKMVVPSLFECLNNNDDASPEQVKERVIQLNKRDPRRLEKRLAKNIKSEHKKKKKEKLTDARATELSKKTIAYVLTMETDDIVEVSFESKLFAEAA